MIFCGTELGLFERLVLLFKFLHGDLALYIAPGYHNPASVQQGLCRIGGKMCKVLLIQCN